MNAVGEVRATLDTPPARGAEANSPPRVRTLLICDLADSTALVERLGDSVAAELIRRHDRVARDLLHRFHGREIDKTDGFLLLFERPVEAVAFALEYQRALHALGTEAKQALRARVGIHVGEVVLWQNSASEIAAGAKPVDVEGLAKPVVARLMALALPGQIVLSGVAFTLAQRAEKELDGASRLRWLTHGRYRFKGVPAPMLVHEVGEAGFAPLQAPPSGPKAERDVPLWRKPGVLALEAMALIAAIAVPFALTLRAPPAIAFGERDWVVVGELRNLTHEPALDASLEAAFRISLEQSRYVNVLPELKLRDTLARMQLPKDSRIDRSVASEIALREGARAVILPTVAEIGGRVRVSAEVIDPHTQTTVYAESADGIGTPSALESIDFVTHELREKLGEALASIEKDSAPLPKVTSADLDALRAYALGTDAQAESRNDEARAFYRRALELDPRFALAHLGLTRLEMAFNDRDAAIVHARRAIALRDRLTARDALYADAWLASFGPPLQAIDKWTLLAELYPDYYAGSYNAALYAAQDANRYAQAEQRIRPALAPQNPLATGAHYTLASLLAANERFAEAETHYENAERLGETAGSQRVLAQLAQGRREEAAALLEGLTQSSSGIERLLLRRTELALAIDAGSIAEANRIVQRAMLDPAATPTLRAVFDLGGLAAAGLESATVLRKRASARIAAQHELLAQGDALHRDQQLFGLMLAAYAAARGGHVDLAQAVLQAQADAAVASVYPNVRRLARLVQAETLRAQGEAEAALDLLERDRDPPGEELYQWHSSRLRALRAAGREADALGEARWLLQHRGRALLEWASDRALTPMNAMDAGLARLDEAELLLASEQPEPAQLALAQFAATWPDPPALVAERMAMIEAGLKSQ